jgi:hypothetical protein
MSPFQSFRLWVRGGAAAERAVAASALLVVVALLAWAVSSAGGGGVGTEVAVGHVAAVGRDTSQTTAPAAAGPGAPSTGGATAGASATPAATTSAGAPVAGSPAAARAGGCQSPPGSAQGVTATEIKISITLADIVGPAANAAFGIPTVAEQQRLYQEVIDDVNAHGGIACRKVVPKYFGVNAADQSDLQQKCLQIAEAGVYANIDSAAYAQYPQKVCFAQHQIPFFGAYYSAESQLRQFAPYLFEFHAFDSLYRNLILGLRDRGFFAPANGFAKLGFIYRDCYPDVIDAMKGWMAQAGVSGDRLVTYSVGCPSVFASPADLTAAVVQFRRAGVTHVTTAIFVGDIANFTSVAQQQGFRPKYGLPDDALVQLTYGNQKPDYDNLAGAVTITASRAGEERTPGVTPTAGTARCSAVHKTNVYQQPYVAGRACSGVWMFQAAVEHAPNLSPPALAVGLQRAGSVDFSYPEGPNDFSRKEPFAGQFWRAAEFRKACDCWQLLEQEFHPSFR